MAQDPDTPDLQGIIVEPLTRALRERYLTYALSTITNRALPDARDGLKPVHRRILYAMQGLRLDPQAAFRKCAKIVGEVMGNYHPHGDQAIYDALARLAQDFALRYPLVQGQGNFGNIDGDNPAAQRYTEARLTAVAEVMLAGLAEDAVDFRPTYDGSDQEPEVLPGAFPNLLANGSSGIAVGMATNIPPHNAGEICDAALHLIRFPDADAAALHALVPGPDFPTGGIIVEAREALAEAYRTGRGAIRLRARWHQEDLGRGTWSIIVTEIPYQVQKSKLIERLAELVVEKKLPLLGDIRDESAEDIRIVIEPRSRTVDPHHLMEALYKQTELELRFPMNMTVLIDGRTPQVCGLKALLRAFLDHRRDVLVRRSRHRLDRIAARLEVLEGYITAFLNLDRVIAIIRAEDEPKPVLMAEFALSDVQAEAILNLRLRALRRLEELELRAERDRLSAERSELDALVGSDALQWSAIAAEIGEVRTRFGAPPAYRGVTFVDDLTALKARDGAAYPIGARRTGFADMPELAALPIAAMVEREPVTIVCSRLGWIRAMKGHLAPEAELKFKDGDTDRFRLTGETTDRLIVVASTGRFYTLPCDRLPGGRGMGEPLRLMIDLAQDAEIVTLLIHRPGGRLLLASSDGDGFLVGEDDVLAQTRAGKAVQSLREGARTRVARPFEGDHVAVVGENRKLLVFPATELPQMARGKGVRLQRYKDGGLSDAIGITLAAGLGWRDPAGRIRTEPDLAEWIGPRASGGRTVPRGFPRDTRFAG